MARRTKVGSQVKVVGSHYPELLVDMGLLGPDKQARNDVWMHGTVISGSSHHWLVKLPGAEAELQFPKEKVQRIPIDHNCPPCYVVMPDNTIKTVHGVEFGTNFMSEDYYHTFEDALAAVPESARTKNTPESTPAPVDVSATTDAPTPAVS